MTITLNNLPDEVERALREFAATEHKTIDAAAVDALARGLGIGNLGGKKRDLAFMAQGDALEPEVIRALEEQRQIDPELWR